MARKLALKNVSVKSVQVTYAGEDISSIGIKFKTYCNVDVARIIGAFSSVYDDSEKPSRPRPFKTFKPGVFYADAAISFIRNAQFQAEEMRGRVKDFEISNNEGKLEMEFNLNVGPSIEVFQFLLDVKQVAIPEVVIQGAQRDLFSDPDEDSKSKQGELPGTKEDEDEDEDEDGK